MNSDIGAAITLASNRRTKHLFTLVEDVFPAGKIALHFVSESLDTSKPHSSFVLTSFGDLAQIERELIRGRTKSDILYKREKG